ncbi:MAG TPA: hypothetical protein VME22_19235 [Solirubrobacteraceae bacterium]|nr:hypothetical protein [Solirubrobacteraceae bacterium]
MYVGGASGPSVKYTVPPDSLVPLGLVGCVKPGPVVGAAADAVDAELLLLLDEPQAAASSTHETAPMTVISPRLPPRIFV